MLPRLTRSPTVEALRLRDYRRYWLAATAGGFGMNFWFLAAAWLMLELTDSPLLVGLINGFAAAPSIALSLFGGALADRLDRRRLLTAALATWAAIALATAVLAATGTIEAWHVLALAAGLGLADAASNPAWQTLVVDLVGKSRLVAANALAQLGEFGGELIAPLAAGLVIAAWSTTPVFFAAAVVLGLGAVLVRSVRMPPAAASEAAPSEARPSAEASRRLLADVRGGLGYTLRTPPFPGLLAVSATVVLSAAVLPLIPVYGRDELGVGAEGFGVMAAALAGGLFAGAAAMAAIGDLERRGPVIFATRALWFVAMAAFAVSNLFWLSVALLFVMGAGGAVSANLLITQFQVHAEDRMRGRVMSLVRVADSLDPIGAVLGGALAVAFGNEQALLLCAAAGLALLAAIAVLSPATLRD